jgi:glycosyltransferase involved in cell wall biosynthesis
MPFFSVCIETYNRGKTIYNTIKSVSNQSCKDYELILIDNASTDNTLDEIRRALTDFDFTSYYVTFNLRHLPNISNWNEPLKHAKGKYVLMLEGDDIIRNNHLEKAYRILKDSDYGIYQSCKTSHKEGKIFFIDYLKMLYGCKFAPAPSDAIFIRTDREGKPFFYDVDSYSYCPELDLYIRIAMQCFHAYQNNSNTVMRNHTNRLSLEEKILYAIRDSHVMLEKYSYYFPKELYCTAFIRLLLKDVFYKMRLLCKKK